MSHLKLYHHVQGGAALPIKVFVGFSFNMEKLSWAVHLLYKKLGGLYTSQRVNASSTFSLKYKPFAGVILAAYQFEYA